MASDSAQPTVRGERSQVGGVMAVLRLRYRQWIIYFAFVALVIVFTLTSKQFLAFGNIINIFRQTAVVSIIGFAMTFVLTAGEIDLSIGAVMAVSSLVASLILRDGGNWILASLAGLAAGTAFGLFNGLLVTRAKIPSFLVTLGSMGIARGTALTVTGTLTIVYVNDSFKQFWGAGDVGPIPAMVIWTLIILVITYFLFNHTLFGRYVQATGGNLMAARYSGVKTDRIKLLALTMTGLAAGLGGLLMTARLASGRPYIGDGLEMDVIAACILGGTSLFGGKGTIIGTLVGALMIGVINNGLILLGIGTNVQMIVKGAIIIAAVFFGEKAL